MHKPSGAVLWYVRTSAGVPTMNCVLCGINPWDFQPARPAGSSTPMVGGMGTPSVLHSLTYAWPLFVVAVETTRPPPPGDERTGLILLFVLCVVSNSFSRVRFFSSGPLGRSPSHYYF